MDDRQRQIHQDAKTGNSQIGQIYYHRCEDDPNYYRTIRVVHSPFANTLKPHVSNVIYGTPPPDMKPIPPLMRTKLMSCSNALPY